MSKRKSGGAAAVNAPFGIMAPSSGDPGPAPSTPKELTLCESEKHAYELALRRLHSPGVWLRCYRGESTREGRPSPPLIRSLRCLVQMQTVGAVLRGKYFLEDGTPVLLDKKHMLQAAQKTKVYTSEHSWNRTPTSSSDGKEARIIVLEGDCLEAASWLMRTQGAKNPIVLNMASMSLPGGGYRNGAGAQEENLHRRSNLFQCLEDPYRTVEGRPWSYPIPEFGGIYVPKVSVFRGAESKGYPYLPRVEYISFVCVAAYKHPSTEETKGGTTTERVLDKKMAAKTKRKLMAMFEIALDNGHTSIVLSAFGCGAYENPPHHVALLFAELIRENQYNQKFEHIVFAIYNDHNAKKDHNPEGNVQPFAKAFKVPAVQLDDLQQEQEDNTKDQDDRGRGKEEQT